MALRGRIVDRLALVPYAGAVVPIVGDDSVGVLSNLFPASIAAYNLFLDTRKPREDTT